MVDEYSYEPLATSIPEYEPFIINWTPMEGITVATNNHQGGSSEMYQYKARFIGGELEGRDKNVLMLTAGKTYQCAESMYDQINGAYIHCDDNGRYGHLDLKCFTVIDNALARHQQEGVM